jgi:hypothetical protein
LNPRLVAQHTISSRADSAALALLRNCSLVRLTGAVAPAGPPAAPDRTWLRQGTVTGVSRTDCLGSFRGFSNWACVDKAGEQQVFGARDTRRRHLAPTLVPATNGPPGVSAGAGRPRRPQPECVAGGQRPKIRPEGASPSSADGGGRGIRSGRHTPVASDPVETVSRLERGVVTNLQESCPGRPASLDARAAPMLGAVAGSCATAARESSQGRKAAALSGYGRVP